MIPRDTLFQKAPSKCPATLGLLMSPNFVFTLAVLPTVIWIV